MPEAGNPYKATMAVMFAVGAAVLAAADAVIVRAPDGAVHPSVIDFLRLPLVAFGGLALFGEHIALTTFLGGGLICCAALIAARSGKATSA